MTRYFYAGMILLLVSITLNCLLVSCSKDDVTKNTQQKPEAKLAGITTINVSEVKSTTASSGGTITTSGGSEITEKGVVYATNSNPTIGNSKVVAGRGIASFEVTLSGLKSDSDYFIRAYATNGGGTAYGNELNFHTAASDPGSTHGQLATLSTIPPTAITTANATTGGNITSDGGSEIKERGVVYSTLTNPTIADQKLTAGSGIGSYAVNLSNLKSATKYYLKAYAINSTGIAYGNEIILQTLVPEPDFSNLDKAMLQTLEKYNVPGISIAIIRSEKLVYVKSYGYADRENKLLTSNENLFRIASVSKPITLVAILKLVQDNSISLDQKVFGIDGILGTDYGVPPPGSKIDLITIRHLLDHKSGWTNSPDDPMFSRIDITQKEIIKDVIINRPLATEPGSASYYSNFGYCVLGRVIEKVSHMTYADFVKTNILAPSGITQMEIAGNTLNERLPNEVKYYQSEFSPYIMNIKRMDSHGGWAASATDLARFMVKVDRNSLKPDIISGSLLNQFYFEYTSWLHSGSLPGTSAILSRMDNTFSFVILANTRTSPDGNIIINDLNNALRTQIQLIDSWPATDLF